jgi:hypothetical protein
VLVPERGTLTQTIRVDDGHGLAPDWCSYADGWYLTGTLTLTIRTDDGHGLAPDWCSYANGESTFRGSERIDSTTKGIRTVHKLMRNDGWYVTVLLRKRAGT